MTLRRPSGRHSLRWIAPCAIALLGLLSSAPSFANDEIGGAEAKRIAHRYVGVRKCQSCHKKELLGNQLKAWQKGPHRRAFETLKNEESIALAAERGLALPAHQAPECLGCHITGYALPEAAFAYEIDVADGVQCESCHGPGRDYRKKKVMSDPELAAAKGLWDLSEGTKVCVSCHNPLSPTWDPARYTQGDGTTTGFHFQQAAKRIPHPIPEDTKGRYLEIEQALKDRGLEVE
jgi:hypothetical protein